MDEIIIGSLKYAVLNRIPSDDVIPIYNRILPTPADIRNVQFTNVRDVLDISKSYYDNLAYILRLNPFARDDYVKYLYLMKYMGSSISIKAGIDFLSNQDVSITETNISSVAESRKDRLIRDREDLIYWQSILAIFDLHGRCTIGSTVFKYAELNSLVNNEIDFHNLFKILTPSEICPIVSLMSGPKKIYAVYNPLTTYISGSHTLRTLFDMMMSAREDVRFPEEKNKFVNLHKTILNAVIWLDYPTRSMYKNSFQPLTIYSASPSLVRNFKKFKQNVAQKSRMLEKRTYLNIPITNLEYGRNILHTLKIDHMFDNLSMINLKCTFEILDCKYDRYSFEMFISDHYSDLIRTKDTDSSGWEKSRHTYLYNIISNRFLTKGTDRPYVLSFSIKDNLQIGSRKVISHFGQTLNIEHQSTYQTIRVTKCYNNVIFRHFREFMANMFQHYQKMIETYRTKIRSILSGYDSVLEYEKMIYIENSVNKKSTYTKLMTLKSIVGGSRIFPSGYPKICHSDKQPIPIPEDERQDWMGETFINKDNIEIDRQILDFRELPLPDNIRSLKSDLLFVCPSDNYPYPGVKYNKIYSGPDDVRYFPCCFQKDQMSGHSRSMYNIAMGKNIVSRRQPRQIIRSSRVLSSGRIGFISDELTRLFSLHDDKVYYRVGVANDNNSLINACLLISNISDYPDNIRKKMVDYIHLIGQETHDMDTDNIRKSILDGESLNPLIYSRILEHIFEFNIFMFSATDMYIPRSSSYYVKSRDYRDSACILYYPPHETNLTHHCEPIVAIKDMRDIPRGYNSDNIYEISPDVEFDWILDSTDLLYDLMSDKTVVEYPPVIPFKIVGQKLDKDGRSYCININITSSQSRISKTISMFPRIPIPPVDIGIINSDDLIDYDHLVEIIKVGYLDQDNNVQMLNIIGISTISAITEDDIEDMFIGIWIRLDTNPDITGDTYEDIQKSDVEHNDMFIMCEPNSIPSDLDGYDNLDSPPDIKEIIQNNLLIHNRIEKINVIILNIILYLFQLWKLSTEGINDVDGSKFYEMFKLVRSEDKQSYNNMDIDTQSLRDMEVSNNDTVTFEDEFYRLSNLVMFLSVSESGQRSIILYSDRHIGDVKYFVNFFITQCGSGYNKVNLLEDAISFNFRDENRSSLIFTDTSAILSWIFAETQRMNVFEGLTDELLRSDTINLSVREMIDGKMVDSLYTLWRIYSEDIGLKIGKIWETKNINIKYNLDMYESVNGQIDISDVGIIRMALDTSRVPAMISSSKKTINVKILSRNDDMFVMLRYS